MAWIHLCVLWTFAVAQPLFAVLANEPAFFVARGNTRGDIIVLALALVLAVPTLLVALEALTLPLGVASRALHLLFVGVLVAAVVLQLFHDRSSEVLLPAAAIVGALGALAYAKSRIVSSALTVLGPAPLLLMLFFLLVSPVSKLVLPQGAAGPAGVEITADTPMVMVIWDELPVTALVDNHGHVDPVRFPNFAALARQATWYRNATTVADVTSQAVPAILTGQLPRQGKLPIASDHPGNLFTLLGTNYSLDVHESATRLCPDELCGEAERPSRGLRLEALGEDLGVVALHQLLPRDMTEELPAVDRTFGDFRRPAPQSGDGTSVPDAALAARDRQFESFMDGVGGAPPAKRLSFHHAQLPHTPSQFLPSGQQYPDTGFGTPGLLGDAVWAKDESLVIEVLQRHFLQQAYADRLLGDLMKRLKERGLWERALVVVVADHGIAFERTVGRRYVTRGNFGEVAGVPFFVKAPGQRAGRVDDSAARTIDLLPTVADHLGIRVPWDTDGHSLLEQEEAEPRVLTIERLSGEEVRMPFEQYERRRRAAVTRTVARVGSHQPAERLFDLDVSGALVGRPTAAFPLSAASEVEVELDAPGLYSSVKPASRFVPSYISGELKGRPALGQPLAIAVNGTVRTVVRPYRYGPLVRFGAMLAPSAFRAGRNRVEVFAVQGRGKERSLVLLNAEGAPELVRRDGRDAIVLPSGEAMTLQPGRVSGRVERVTADGDHLTVIGWAAQPASRRPADRVFLFAGGELLASATPFTPRPGLAGRLGAAAQRAGFELRTLSSRARLIRDPSRLHVIATTGGSASELSSRSK